MAKKTAGMTDGYSRHKERFAVSMIAGIILLLLVLVLTMVLGASRIPLKEILDSFFAYDPENFTQQTVRNIRLPRWVADVIVGASLSVAGVIMQGTTKNPMADSGIMGISAGSTLGVVIVMAFIPEAGRFQKMGISALGAAGVTALIYLIAWAGGGRITPDRMVLSGMAISTLLTSLTSAIILKNNLMNEMIRYTSGSSANTIWKDIRVAAPFFLAGAAASIVISRSLTVMNLGEDVSRGLGANVKVTRAVSTVIVLVLSAVAVIIIGPVAYIGLMIPYAARYLVGTDYRLVLPVCMIYGALFVTAVDLLAKTIHPGREFPIGLLITMVGVPFFIYVSRKQEGDHFA
ncbi:MAG: iron ABC transporter permease [Eubacterium sp.]|nr:iron ABC transporter permease [Eubacterium sp.]